METVADVGGAMRGMEEVRVSPRSFRPTGGSYLNRATNAPNLPGETPDRTALSLFKQKRFC